MGVCLDTSHANISGDLLKITKKCDKDLLTTHISDNRGRTDDHFLPFEGKIDWREFLKALKETEYEEIFMLETRQTRDPAEILRETKEIWENKLKGADERKNHKD